MQVMIMQHNFDSLIGSNPSKQDNPLLTKSNPGLEHSSHILIINGHKKLAKQIASQLNRKQPDPTIKRH